MERYILTFLIVILFIIQLNVYYSNHKISINKKFKEFNELTRIIEKSQENNKLDILCINSKKASNLIHNNLKNLINIEPKYDWVEIKELLDEISSQICKN